MKNIIEFINEAKEHKIRKNGSNIQPGDCWQCGKAGYETFGMVVKDGETIVDGKVNNLIVVTGKNYQSNTSMVLGNCPYSFVDKSKYHEEFSNATPHQIAILNTIVGVDKKRLDKYNKPMILGEYQWDKDFYKVQVAKEIKHQLDNDYLYK